MATKKKRLLWVILGLTLGGIAAASLAVLLGVFIWRAMQRLPDDTSSADSEQEGFSTQVEEVAIQKAASCSEIISAAESAEETSSYGSGLREDFASQEMEGAGDEEAPAKDYSETNVQVEGIDEADVVKNDGQFIYYVRDGKVGIAKAFPAEEMAVLSHVESDHADFSNIYIHNNYLVALGMYNSYEREEALEQDSSEGEQTSVPLPDWYYGSILEIWDISDKAEPLLVKGWLFDGSISSSRLTQGEIYLVMQTDTYYIQENDVVPQFKVYGEEVQDLCGCEDVWLPEDPWSSNYVEVVGLDLDNLDQGLSSEVAFGLGDIVYMSTEHIFLAGEYYEYASASGNWWDFWGGWTTPTDPVEKTIITKFDYGNGSASYVNSGQVKGSLLNQFSMDEYEDYLRVAVTKGRWTSDVINGVYILDSDLEISGSLSGLAQGEEIYAVRFMGEKGYIVTFEQIDPLFVLDLSDPENPEVLGELKIPGYSDYLHPWGDDYLIGFGMEATDRFGWVEEDGVKVAVFDVSDPTNPRELSKIEIGGSGSYSEILYNHRALLVNEQAGWFAIPIYEYEGQEGVIEYGPDNELEWDTTEFQGLYVFDVSDAGKLSLRGKITHYLPEDFDEEVYYDSDVLNREVKRGVYMDSILYVLSDEKLSAHDLGSLVKLKQITWVTVEEGE